jgi:hypothetical protein
VEKMATQIIRNVQVKITDIHLRYEDKVTQPERPFSLGITLRNLSVHTTDENWKACIVQDAATVIYKVRNNNMFYVQWDYQNDSHCSCVFGSEVIREWTSAPTYAFVVCCWKLWRLTSRTRVMQCHALNAFQQVKVVTVTGLTQISFKFWSSAAPTRFCIQMSKGCIHGCGVGTQKL